MYPIKEFWVKDGKPSDEQIEKAIAISHDENCVVILRYSAFRTQYSVTIFPETSFEESKNQIPRVFGM